MLTELMITLKTQREVGKQSKGDPQRSSSSGVSSVNPPDLQTAVVGRVGLWRRWWQGVSQPTGQSWAPPSRRSPVEQRLGNIPYRGCL